MPCFCFLPVANGTRCYHRWLFCWSSSPLRAFFNVWWVSPGALSPFNSCGIGLVESHRTYTRHRRRHPTGASFRSLHFEVWFVHLIEYTWEGEPVSLSYWRLPAGQRAAWWAWESLNGAYFPWRCILLNLKADMEKPEEKLLQGTKNIGCQNWEWEFPQNRDQSNNSGYLEHWKAEGKNLKNLIHFNHCPWLLNSKRITLTMINGVHLELIYVRIETSIYLNSVYLYLELLLLQI